MVDLGCGTGIWAGPLAEWLDACVVGVDPSRGMLGVARRARWSPRVRYLCGRAEELPVRDRSIDLAWLSTVVHHFSDLPRAAGELARVVRPGGRVMVRGAFPGRLDEIPLFRWFPEARRVADGFPTIERVVDGFARAGFVAVAVEGVRAPVAPSLRVFAARVAAMHRSDSTLAALSRHEFARRLSALRDAAACEHPASAVYDRLDVVVLERSGESSAAPVESTAVER